MLLDSEKIPDQKPVVLDGVCTNQAGETVLKGEALVIAPTQKVRRPRAVLPEVHLHERGARLRQLIEAAQKCQPI